MKFKFKAKPQDWLIFAIFAVVLWFLVAIFVNNISVFATTGKFAGLNPFPGMINHLSACILFYIAFLVVIFTSVKDYFFEKEKGFGIKFGSKEEKSFSRLATEKEVKAVLSEVNIKDNNYEAAGIPLINDGKKMWVDNKESHNIIIGSTGSGKTQDIVHPMVKALARKGESMVITDPKGEIYEEAAGLLKSKGYNIVVLNFREPQKGNCWNPLALPYELYKNGNTDKAMELLDDVAANILYEEGNKDPFWEKTAADYFVGLTLGLFEDAKPEQININSVSLMTSIGEEKYGPRSTYIKEYFNGKDPSSASYISASGTVFAPEETKGSILSTMRQKIRIFASRENLSEMLARSDFDMSTIGTEKTAIFIVIQDEKKTYHALATIFIKQCYESLIGVAQNLPGGHLKIRTNFILDEFANMPPLKDVTTMITAARSRWVRFTMIIQNFAQLDQIYGKENAQTIRSNCNNLLYLLTTELAALKEISELSGERKVKVGKGDKEHEETRPLISVSELQQMKENEAVLIRIRLGTAKVKLYPNWKTDWGIPKIEADPYVQREKMPIDIFNLKTFMDEKKHNKFMDMLNGQGGGTSHSMMDSNPFVNNNLFDSNPFKQEMPSSNPFVSLIDEQPKQNAGFNMDDLVKKIDAKIAELEAEEKREREKMVEKVETSVKETTTNNFFLDSSPVINSNIKEIEIKKDEKLEQPIIDIFEQPEIEIPKKVESELSDYHKNSITDDQFFDEFFDEQ